MKLDETSTSTSHRLPTFPFLHSRAHSIQRVFNACPAFSKSATLLKHDVASHHVATSYRGATATAVCCFAFRLDISNQSPNDSPPRIPLISSPTQYAHLYTSHTLDPGSTGALRVFRGDVNRPIRYSRHGCFGPLPLVYRGMGQSEPLEHCCVEVGQSG